MVEMSRDWNITREQVQTVVSDTKCQELWHFLRKMRSEDVFTRRSIIRYRRKAEQHVGSDDNLYRVEWVCMMYGVHKLTAWMLKLEPSDRGPKVSRCGFSWWAGMKPVWTATGRS